MIDIDGHVLTNYWAKTVTGKHAGTHANPEALCPARKSRHSFFPSRGPGPKSVCRSDYSITAGGGQYGSPACARNTPALGESNSSRISRRKHSTDPEACSWQEASLRLFVSKRTLRDQWLLILPFLPNPHKYFTHGASVLPCVERPGDSPSRGATVSYGALGAQPVSTGARQHSVSRRCAVHPCCMRVGDLSLLCMEFQGKVTGLGKKNQTDG